MSSLINTPYYRTLAITHSLGCDDEQDFMYGPYDIFCIETRFYPVVYKIYDRDVELIFKTVYENNRMNLKIDLVKVTDIKMEPIKNDPINISDSDRKILDKTADKIFTENPDYCLIDKHELWISSGKRYLKGWFNSILGYIPITTEYNPFFKSEGIYLKFNRDGDFKTAYNDVVRDLLNTVDSWYREGIVYGAGNIAEKWKLERLDYEEEIGRLYKPVWSDLRFAPNIVDFLLRRISGESFIQIEVPDNLVKRHLIAKKLLSENIEFVFSGSYVKIKIDNIDDAQYVSSLISTAKKDITSKVIVYYVNRKDWVTIYTNEAKKELENPDCIGYRIENVEKPYVFSCLTDVNTPSNLFQDFLRDQVLSDLTKSYRKSK